MITLHKLKWSNCFSYGPDNELNLDDNTVTQIIGTNGMGKSSIPLIIEEALFNKNSKGIKKADIPNRDLNDGYQIHLTFFKDEDKYEVEVIRKASVKVRLFANGEDISSHTATNTYKTIQELVGVDFKTFSQLVYQNTNNSLQFLTATDTNRKKFLIDLLQLEKYVELFEVFKKAAKEASTEVTKIESVIDTVTNWLDENKLEDTTPQPLIEEQISTEEYQKELGTLTQELENISERNRKIENNNKYREMLNEIDLSEVSHITVDKEVSYDDLQSQLGEQDGVISAAKRMLQKLQKLGDHCPTCEQDVDAGFKKSLIDQEREKLEEAQSAAETLKDDIEAIKKQNRLVRHRRKVEKDWEDLYRSIDPNLPETLLDKESLEESIGRVSAELRRAKSRAQEIERENRKRAQHNAKVEVIEGQIKEFEERLDTAQSRLNESVEKLSNLEVLKKAFSTNGLLAYKIENLVEELEELVNTYLAELSDGRFTLEFVVNNDKLNVEITDKGNVVDILALSSGELARVNTATLLAIRKLMSSISKSRINILFLDEVINVLDSSGREKLVEVLLKEDLNTFIVSHFWSHPLLTKVEIIKQEGISVLETE